MKMRVAKSKAKIAAKAIASDSDQRRKTGESRSSQTAKALEVGENADISFYRANEKPYGPLSNLYQSKVTFEGITYPTAEHAYQAAKARKAAVRDWILAAPTPALAAMAAHNLYTWDVASNWSSIKFERMRSVLRAKFEQHQELRELLLSTGDARLVEAGRVDNSVNRLWGEVNGVGQNMLGLMLMELRTELRLEDAKVGNRRPRALAKASARGRSK